VTADTENWLENVQRKYDDLMLSIQSNSRTEVRDIVERYAGRVANAHEMFKLSIADRSRKE
jgi:hypothetical protein